jgi:putative peptide zinc metalloprotease protein
MVPGRLVSWKKKPGESVRAEDTIAELDSVDLRLQLVEAEGEYDLAYTRLQIMQNQLTNDPQARSQFDTQSEIVRAKADMVLKLQERINLLKVTAKADGVILEPPSKPIPKQAESEEQLPMWHGNPFDDANAGAVFSESDLLCLIGEPGAWDAVLVVDQHDVDLVYEGVEAEIMIDSARLDTFTGKMEKISEMEMKVSPENLALQAGGRLDTEMDASGRMRPISTSYQARVPLENVDVPLRSGYRGQAKIYVGWKSIGWRIYRFCTRTFKFEM